MKKCLFYVIDKRLGAWRKRGAVNLLFSCQRLLFVATTHSLESLVSCLVDVAGFETVQQADKRGDSRNIDLVGRE